MNFFIHISTIISLTLAACPLCVLTAASFFGLNFSPEHLMIGNAFAVGMSAPFMMAFIDGFRVRNMTFDLSRNVQVHRSSESESILHSGHSYDLYIESYGLDSKLRLRTSRLYLLNETFERVAVVGKDLEFKVLAKVERSWRGMPRYGMGYMRFSIPQDTPDGIYYLKYLSAWTIWKHEAKFQSLSKPIFITRNESCINVECLKKPLPVARNISEMNKETAPLELQFMFSTGPMQAIQESIDGVLGGFGTPVKALLNIPHWIKNPFQAFKNEMDEWDDNFDAQPYKQTGQVVGAVLSLSLLANWAKKRLLGLSSEPKCPGGVCVLEPNKYALIKVEGLACQDCVNTVLEMLKKQKIDSQVLDEGYFLVKKSPLKANEIVEKIIEVGFDARCILRGKL